MTAFGNDFAEKDVVIGRGQMHALSVAAPIPSGWILLLLHSGDGFVLYRCANMAIIDCIVWVGACVFYCLEQVDRKSVV